MTYVILLIVLVVLLVAIIRVVAGSDRHAKMTEEEFEAEAKRVSMQGVALAEFQKHVDPIHKVEYLLQRDKHVEAESSESGDRPPAPPDSPAKS